MQMVIINLILRQVQVFHISKEDGRRGNMPLLFEEI